MTDYFLKENKWNKVTGAGETGLVRIEMNGRLCFTGRKSGVK